MSDPITITPFINQGIKKRKKDDPAALATSSETIEREWQSQLERLQAFKYQHGHCEVPKKYPGALGVWIRKQRLDKKQRHRCLTPERQRLLEELEFSWSSTRARVTSFSETQEAKWDAMFQRLKDYKTTFGHSNVPYSYKADKKLSTWVLNQRQEYKLKPYLFRTNRPDGVTRKEKMDGLDFIWTSQRDIVAEEKWDEMFQRLLVYKKEHNHCNVPRFYDKGERLSLWVVRQRQELKNNKHLLTAPRPDGSTRKQLLDDVGFTWKLRERVVSIPDSEDWDHMLDILLLYKLEYGNCNVPRDWEEDITLAKWAVRQRRDLKNNVPAMTSAHNNGDTRQEILNDIGFVWDLRTNNSSKPKTLKVPSTVI